MLCACVRSRSLFPSQCANIAPNCHATRKCHAFTHHASQPASQHHHGEASLACRSTQQGASGGWQQHKTGLLLQYLGFKLCRAFRVTHSHARARARISSFRCVAVSPTEWANKLDVQEGECTMRACRRVLYNSANSTCFILSVNHSDVCNIECDVFVK